MIRKIKDAIVRPKVQRVRVMHVSGQFSDNDKQHAADAKAVFERATARGTAWITGTEGGGGSGNWIPSLKAEATAHGFRFFNDPSSDAWIAVRKSFVNSGWVTFTGPTVIPGRARDHTAKKIVSAGFYNDVLGEIHVIAGHYLTKGRPSGRTVEYRQHVEENKAFAKAIGEYAVEVGKGSALVFYGGDQNIVDRDDDTFFGQPMVSAWDEVGYYQNTGHGNIDVIAHYKRDGRAHAVMIGALDDNEFFLNTDHYAIEAVYEIRPLKAKRR